MGRIQSFNLKVYLDEDEMKTVLEDYKRVKKQLKRDIPFEDLLAGYVMYMIYEKKHKFEEE